MINGWLILCWEVFIFLIIFFVNFVGFKIILFIVVRYVFVGFVLLKNFVWIGFGLIVVIVIFNGFNFKCKVFEKFNIVNFVVE